MSRMKKVVIVAFGDESKLAIVESNLRDPVTVVEQKVDVEVFAIELNALLASDEGETGASSSRNISNSRRTASSKSRSM